MRIWIGIIMIISLLLPGCRRVEGVVWSSYTDLPPNGWDPIHVLGFSPWPEDSVVNPSDRFNLTLSLRFSARKNLPPITIVVRQEDNMRFLSADTLEIHPAAPASRPFGQGAYGVFETSDTILRNIKLTDGYLIELQSLSPQESTIGLMNIGLTLSLEGVPQKKFTL